MLAGEELFPRHPTPRLSVLSVLIFEILFEVRMSRAAKHKSRKPERLTRLKRILLDLPHSNYKNQVPPLDGIRSAHEFRAILNRERARVNRNGHEFSLVVFDLDRVQPNSAYARWLTHVLSHRVRAIDEIGWFDDRCVGVVLPYTGPEGASKLVDDVRQRISARAFSPRYTVYTYPSRWMAPADSSVTQRRSALSLK